MLEKIVFLCVDPWEGFLAPAFQNCGREYFQWIYKQALLKKVNVTFREKKEIYGEIQTTGDLFLRAGNQLQLLYVCSHREHLLETVFSEADLVLMGIPANLKKFEKTFLPVLPWKDQIVFLWEQYLCKDEKVLHQLCSEYKLRESQMITLRRGINGELSGKR